MQLMKPAIQAPVLRPLGCQRSRQQAMDALCSLLLARIYVLQGILELILRVRSWDRAVVTTARLMLHRIGVQGKARMAARLQQCHFYINERRKECYTQYPRVVGATLEPERFL